MKLFDGPTTAVGKIRGEPEYLRAETDTAALFDEWLAEGFDLAHERWRDEWRAAVRMGDAHAFVWWPKSGTGPLCGILGPSRDAVGRDYPVAVFARIRHDALRGTPHLLLLAVGEFLDAACDLVELARTTPMDRNELRVRLQELPAPEAAVLQQTGCDYLKWCGDMRFDAGWRAVLTDRATTIRPDDVVSLLGRQKGSEGVRLPSGEGGAAAVALWLDVAARSGRFTSPLSVFWSASARSLLLAPSLPSASTLGTLWSPTGAAVHLECKERREGEAFVEAGSATMAEYLASLPIA